MDEFMKTFRENQEHLAEQHHGEYVLISTNGVLGTFPSRFDAYWGAIDDQKLVPGNFLIRECLFRNEERPVLFYSNVK